MNKYPHPPGSKEAMADGCICPGEDNHGGRGSGYHDADGWPVYWTHLDCKLHSNKEDLLLGDALVFWDKDFEADK